MKRHKNFRVAPFFIILGMFMLFCIAVVAFATSNSASGEEEHAAPPTTQEPEVLVVVRYATEQEEAERDRETVEALAQTVWGEGRGLCTTEQAAIVWNVLNRVDSPDFPDDPLLVVQQSGQYCGYDPSYPVEPQLVALVEDVLARWEMESSAVGSVGRVLPREYVFFCGRWATQLLSGAIRADW